MDRAPAVARQVVIGVVGEVHHGGLVAFGPVLPGEGAVLQDVGHLRPEVAGEALLPVGGVQGEGDAVFPAGISPQLLVKALSAAVEGVGPLVGGEAVFRAVHGERGAADAVGTPADGAAEAGVLVPVLLQGVIAQADVRGPALPVRHPERADGGAVGQQLHGNVSVRQPDEGHILPPQSAEGSYFIHLSALTLRFR